MKRIAAGYAVVLGVGVVGFWIAALAGGEVPEMETAPVSLGFHLFAEFLLGGVLIAAGIGVLRGWAWGSRLFVLGMGLTIYSVLNAAGYYGQAGDAGPVAVFLAIAAASAGFFVLGRRIELGDGVQGRNIGGTRGKR